MLEVRNIMNYRLDFRSARRILDFGARPSFKESRLSQVGCSGETYKTPKWGKSPWPFSFGWSNTRHQSRALASITPHSSGLDPRFPKEVLQ